MNELIVAALVAMYVTGAEHNLDEMQQSAASEFCDLIELNANEFAKLGLTLN